jgi:hypothetical protein
MKITKELKENFDFLGELVSACNSQDGSLESYEAYEFDDDFFDNYFESKIEIARATFFGDIQNWNDDYIRFNGYGNLESLSSYLYENELIGANDEIITEAERLRDEIDLDEIIKRYK